MDGTLTETSQLIYDSFNHIARMYAGKTYTIPEITAMFGPPEEGALLAIVSKEQIADAMKEYLLFYRTHHNHLARLFPGIEEILKFIKERGKKLAIFTGKGVYTTTITLQEFLIEEYFDFIVTGNDVIKHKPSSEGLQKIMEHFKLKPNNVLMVGDSAVDAEAAHEAGIEIAAVVWDSYAKEKVLQMKTDYVFYNVEEFHDWLKEQF
jgi:HAD superfamily hydrolase (TIGR01549 family)